MNRFLRENSQYIAAVSISTFGFVCVSFKIYKPYFVKDSHLFKNSSNNYLDVSVKQEENIRKELLRFEKGSARTNIDFIRTNRLDFEGFGFSKLNNGALVTIPVSYFANHKKQLVEQSPLIGYEGFLTNTIRHADLRQKLNETELEDFYSCILLSDDAKLYGLVRSIVQTNHIFYSCLDNFIDLLGLCSAYIYSYSVSRAYSLQLKQRRRVYFMSATLALTSSILIRLFVQSIQENKFDREACRLGLDCCEGAIEYFEKLLNRNKILRNVIPNGHELIDEEGNYKKQFIKIPLVNYYIPINYLGNKLTERRDKCKKELEMQIQRLSREMELKEIQKSKQAAILESKNDDKEWRIFKELRLKIESRNDNSDENK